MVYKRVLLTFLCLFMVFTTYSQTRKITGEVVDAQSKEPIIGAVINVVGTSEGTVTNMDGQFTLEVPDDANTQLRIKLVGYVEQVVKIGIDTKLTIQLADDDKSLDEVVVVGYGTVKRKDLTGSVSSVTSKEIADIPLNSAAEVLTGRLAGVNITSSEGAPGADVTVRVRGGGSITQDNSPIYIVDGIQIENALQFISPQEIESVDVLKDAASTAIYGARGANGVIVITTKSGKAIKTKISYDAFFGKRKIVNKLDVMKPYDFVKYQYQIYNYNTDSATQVGYTNRYGRYEDIDIYQNMPYQDWQEQVFGQNASMFTQNLSLLGGDKKNSFSLTLNRSDEEGIMINSGFRRYMASFKFDHTVSDALKVGFNARYSDQRTQGAGTSATGTQGNNRLRNAVRYQPYIGGTVAEDVFDPNYAQLTNLTSPVLLAQQEIKYQYRQDVLINGYVNLNPVKNVTFRSVVGVAPTINRLNQFSGLVTGVARQNADMPVAVVARGSGMTINNSNTISYNKTAKNYNFDVLLGEETYQTNGNGLSTTVKWLPTDITPEEAFSGIQRATPPAGMVQDPATSVDQAPNRLLSFFGRANFSYGDRYLFTATMRRDGSNKFSAHWGTFPSAALAWRMSEEAFWTKIDPHKKSDVKLRLSIGSVGNNRITGDLFRTMYAINQSSYAFFESITPGMAPASLANPEIKWETTISRNVGLDVSLFRNRVNFTADYYVNTTKDLLLESLVPSTTGYNTQIQNIGSTQNRGLELQLNTAVINTRDFHWNSSFNIAFNRNKVTDLGKNPDGTDRTYIKYSSGWITSATMDFLVEVGKPLGQFYGFVNSGYYTLDDFNYDPESQRYTLKDGIPINRTALGNRDPQPGDMKFAKLDGDTSIYITDKDETVIGNALPNFTGGWNNQFTYKNFDMSVFVYFSVGNDVYNANRIEYTAQYLYRDNNMLELMNDRWKWYNDAGERVNDPVELAALNQNTKLWTPAAGQFTPQSFAIEDGSFVRISNVTLGYTFPESWLKKTRIISRFRIYATVNNLYTFTKYTGFDPEANTRRSTPLTPGVDYSAYPRSRLILAGLNMSF